MVIPSTDPYYAYERINRINVNLENIRHNLFLRNSERSSSFDIETYREGLNFLSRNR